MGAAGFRHRRQRFKDRGNARTVIRAENGFSIRGYGAVRGNPHLLSAGGLYRIHMGTEKEGRQIQRSVHIRI